MSRGMHNLALRVRSEAGFFGWAVGRYMAGNDVPTLEALAERWWTTADNVAGAMLCRMPRDTAEAREIGEACGLSGAHMAEVATWGWADIGNEVHEVLPFVGGRGPGPGTGPGPSHESGPEEGA